MSITPEEFKKGFEENSKWGQVSDLVKRLDKKTAVVLYQSMQMVSAYVGLDMRSEFYMNEIKIVFTLGEEK
jgi:hypothetical protein